MKKLLPLFAGILFAGTISAQSIPDGKFETWNTVIYNDPQYFSTSNDQNFAKGADTANVIETTGYLGVNYGVKLQTVSLSGQPQSGYIIDGNPNGNNISGGIPYSQKPTGIRFYYQYAPATNDTAAALVVFRKAGATRDSFLILLTTAESSYTLHSYFPASPVPVTPDTVVVGFVSSLQAITNNGGGHPGSTLTIDSVSFTGVSSQPAELNGDFTSWTSDTALTLTGWYINYPYVTRTTDAPTGDTYALELTTANFPAKGVEQGQASTGYSNNNCNNNCTEEGGRAYAVPASGIDTLKFAYKYAPTTGDTGNVELSFVYKGQTLNVGGGVYLTKTNTSYKDTIIPLNFGSQKVDTVIINISSSQHTNDTNSSQYAPYVGTVLKIDNITFASQSTLGINNIAATEGIKVYPNPANSQVNVDLTGVSGSLQNIAMYDMSGRILSSQNYSGGMQNTIQTIDINSLASGIYLVEVTTSNGKFYQKVAKQ